MISSITSPALLLLSQGASSLFGRARLPLGLLSVLAVSLVTCALLVAEDRRSGGALSRKWIGAAPPEALAAIRIVVLGILFIVVAREDLVSTASMPRSMIELHGKGVMSIVARVPGYFAFIASPTALLVFKLGLLGLLALGVLGFGTRVVLPLSFVSYLLYGGILRQYVHFFHQGLVPLYLLLLLILTPCADAWSLDRRAREKKGLPAPPLGVPASVYGFGRWAIFLLLGLCYFSAGWSKLRTGGLLWWEADNMRAKILLAALDSKLGLPFGAPLAALPNVFLAGLGISTLVIELGAIVAVVSRRSWFVVGPALFFMHLGILITQEILFVDLLLLPVIFLQPHHLARAVAALPRGRREAVSHLRAALAEGGFGRAEAQAPAREEGPARRSHLLAAALIAAYVPLMVFGIEGYPITTWPMYSNRFPTTKVDYLDVQERRADGSSRLARLDGDIGVLIDIRFHWAIWEHFHEGDARTRRRLDDLFARVMELRRARRPEEPRIVGFVVDRRVWDWRASPSDPRSGPRLNHYVYPEGPTGPEPSGP